VSFEELALIMMDYDLTEEGVAAPGKGFACLREKNFDWVDAL
jgi:hypothetical protein